MPAIRETRKLPIRERIITLDNVRALARMLHTEYERLNTKETTADLSFYVTCADGASFQSEAIALFDSDSILSKKRVISIDMDFSHYRSHSKIEIQLAHGNSDFRNVVVIKGEDSNWVNGQLKSIEETISSFVPQRSFVYKYAALANVIFALGFGSLYFWFASLIPMEPSPDKPLWALKLNLFLTSVPLGYDLFKYFIAFCGGYFPAIIFIGKLKSLWPSVELQIGPEHTYIEKRRRIWIANAVILGVFPLVTSLVYDIAKHLAGGYGG